MWHLFATERQHRGSLVGGVQPEVAVREAHDRNRGAGGVVRGVHRGLLQERLNTLVPPPNRRSLREVDASKHHGQSELRMSAEALYLFVCIRMI